MRNFILQLISILIQSKIFLKLNPQNYKDLWSKNESSKIFADKHSTIKIIIKLQWLNAMIYFKLRKYAIRYSILWDLINFWMYNWNRILRNLKIVFLIIIWQRKRYN